ncbi:FlgK family flagellar hook-associated protein [Telmatospirillum siberiense]|uniref:Flagellar hook-associated protein 1 n=1 Tax=Telmatospirillum siberiense TaxID=382514 RepID=A0A2N3PZY6_9PROT|nr:hypothetical protein [Telmatospirillum siberiense]PKU25963.1 hypothetical protein CWS72_02135 [Telmatospirillum siberiense]
MAATGETGAVTNGLTWAQQQAASNGGAAYAAGAAMAAAAAPKTKKTKTERPDESWILGALFPLEAIQSSVEEGLKASIRDAIGTLHTLLADDKISETLQKLLGAPEDPASIAHSMRDLTDAFADMADQQGASSKAVMRAAATFTDKLKTTTTQIQALRSQADSDIGITVGKANAILRQIADLNNKIAFNAAVGQSSSAIGTERDAVLDTLSGTFDFASFNRDDGTVSLYTKGGTPLINGSVTPLEHKATAKIEPSMTLSNGGLSGITANGIDISGHVTAGTLHTLLKTRDATLPNVQSQLDTLAQTLQSHINQISNRALARKGLTSTRRGSRRFTDPTIQKFTLLGGDVILSLSTAEGKPAASVGLSLLMKQYLRSNGLPGNRPWTAPQAAMALNRWFVQRLGTRSEPYTSLNEDGQIVFHLPQGSVTGLTFQDQRSLAYRSSSVADANKPLGLSGTIAFTDSAGNLISTDRANPPQPIVPGDSLTAIAGKLKSLEGLDASVIETESGVALHVATTIGSDISIEPDMGGTNVVAGLGLRPAPDQAQDDVVVNYQPDSQGSSFLSSPRPDATTPLGLDGPLVFRNQESELIAQLILRPDWTLATLTSQINGAAKKKDIKATVIHAGNQVALKIAAPMGQKMRMDGAPDSFRSSPAEAFSAAGGTLAVNLDGKAVGRLDVKAGSDLQTIAETINAPTEPFAACGIRASVEEIGDYSFLEIASDTGLPLAFQGEWKGQGGGDTLALQLNVRDSLGLNPPATQAIPGFTNFLGLNDVLAATPFDAFDGKAPTGVFTTTAIPGTAQSLSLSADILTDASILDDPAFITRIANLLRGQVNLGAAGNMPRGSHTLTNYAETIIATVKAQATVSRGQIDFQRTLLDGLKLQHSRVGGMNMNDTVSTLTAYQQAFHDSSRIVSTMAQLFGSLDAPVH